MKNGDNDKKVLVTLIVIIRIATFSNNSSNNINNAPYAMEGQTSNKYSKSTDMMSVNNVNCTIAMIMMKRIEN